MKIAILPGDGIGTEIVAQAQRAMQCLDLKFETETAPVGGAAYEASGRTATRQVDQLPPADVLAEIERLVDIDALERTLMAEGLKKFADPQKELLALIAEKRAAFVA